MTKTIVKAMNVTRRKRAADADASVRLLAHFPCLRGSLNVRLQLGRHAVEKTPPPCVGAVEPASHEEDTGAANGKRAEDRGEVEAGQRWLQAQREHRCSAKQDAGSARANNGGYTRQPKEWRQNLAEAEEVDGAQAVAQADRGALDDPKGRGADACTPKVVQCALNAVGNVKLAHLSDERPRVRAESSGGGHRESGWASAGAAGQPTGKCEDSKPNDGLSHRGSCRRNT
eukprot:scaffold178111_cov31-Tisochrysis_lutea.AAC.1